MLKWHHLRLARYAPSTVFGAVFAGAAWGAASAIVATLVYVVYHAAPSELTLLINVLAYTVVHLPFVFLSLRGSVWTGVVSSVVFMLVFGVELDTMGLGLLGADGDMGPWEFLVFSVRMSGWSAIWVGIASAAIGGARWGLCRLVTVPSTTCVNCQYDAGFAEVCPECGLSPSACVTIGAVSAFERKHGGKVALLGAVLSIAALAYSAVAR